MQGMWKYVVYLPSYITVCMLNSRSLGQQFIGKLFYKRVLIFLDLEVGHLRPENPFYFSLYASEAVYGLFKMATY